MSDPNNSSSPVPVASATGSQRKAYDLSKFRIKGILNNNSARKTVCCLGHFTDLSDIDEALIIFEKTAFAKKHLGGGGGEADDEQHTIANSNADNESCSGGYFSSQSQLREAFVNDIYGNFECFPNPEINNVKTTIIYPATKSHILKYSVHEVHIIQERPADYDRLTLPYLAGEQFSLNWVYNILEHKQETERIVFEDECRQNGFIILPDLKWDGKTFETLYLIAIVHRHNLKSLRDLNDTHLPLLKNIRDKGIATIKEKYGVERSQLRIYLHYQPSFYHLHVHFTYLKYEAPGIRCERSHLLDTVIDNIELLPDYYQRATLSFVLNDTHSLYHIFKNRQSLAAEQGEENAVRLEVSVDNVESSSSLAKRQKLE